MLSCCFHSVMTFPTVWIMKLNSRFIAPGNTFSNLVLPNSNELFDLLLPFYVFPFSPYVNKELSSTQLLPSGNFLFFWLVLLERYTKIPGNQQLLKYSDQPVWYGQQYHIQSHISLPRSVCNWTGVLNKVSVFAKLRQKWTKWWLFICKSELYQIVFW